MKFFTLSIILLFLLPAVYSQTEEGDNHVDAVIIIDGKLPLRICGWIFSPELDNDSIEFLYVPGSFLLKEKDYVFLKSMDPNQFIRIRMEHRMNPRPKVDTLCIYYKYIQVNKFLYGNFIFYIANYNKRKGINYVGCWSPTGEVELPADYSTIAGRRRFKKAIKVFFPSWMHYGNKYVKSYYPH